MPNRNTSDEKQKMFEDMKETWMKNNEKYADGILFSKIFQNAVDKLLYHDYIYKMANDVEILVLTNFEVKSHELILSIQRSVINYIKHYKIKPDKHHKTRAKKIKTKLHEFMELAEEQGNSSEFKGVGEICKKLFESVEDFNQECDKFKNTYEILPRDARFKAFLKK